MKKKKTKRKKTGEKAKKGKKKRGKKDSGEGGGLRSRIAALHGQLLKPAGLESNIKLHTGVLPLDLILTPSVGLRGGACMEVYGPEGVGKTSLILALIKSAGKAGMTPFLVDAEFSVNPEQCEIFDIEPDKDFLMIQPDSAEEALNTAEMMLKTQPKSLIIIDSIAVLLSTGEWEEKVEDKSYNPVSLMMSKFAKKAPQLCRKNDSIVVYVNQVRANLDKYGGSFRVPGVSTIKFSVAWRLEMFATGKITQGSKEEGEVIGQKVRFKTIKNKFGRPFQTAQSNLIFGQGFHQGYDLCDLTKAFGLKHLIEHNASWITFFDGHKVQGQSKAADYIVNNPEVKERIEKEIVEAFS